MGIDTAEWAKAQGSPVAVKEFPSAEAFLFCYKTEDDFDILLLDIEMGEMSGLELRSGGCGLELLHQKEQQRRDFREDNEF